MIVIHGMGSSSIVTQGYMLSISWPTAAAAEHRNRHGYNRYRLLQWGGPYKPR